jgi:mannose-6-phosphate isomerase-like protein (cupin superfamily)
VRVIPSATAFTAPDDGLNHWVERLRVPAMSVGTYSVPVGGIDDQTPHGEDEIYVVISGRGTLITDDGTAKVEPGMVLYVPAAERHTFTDVTDDLTLLVLFAPASGTTGGRPTS